jgi:medium-chain acyl-[acyl-carrier-protein] hydrolase
LPDAVFVSQVTRRFDGFPPAVRDNDELLALVLPALRADIEALETYRYYDEPPLATDIFALGGADDRVVSVSELADWRRHTTGRFASRMMPGGHFFWFREGVDHRQDSSVVGIISGQLERYVDF